MEPPTPIEGTLTFLHVEFGREQFEIDTARFNIYRSDDGVLEFTVYVTAGSCTLASELQDVASGSPWFEATAVVAEGDSELHSGKVIVQTEGYDSARHLNLSNMFYLSHNNVEELRIEVHSTSEEIIDASLTGSCVINGSLLTQPDARFSLRSRFILDRDMWRGVK